MKGFNKPSSQSGRLVRAFALQSALVASMGAYALPQGGTPTNATIDNSVAGTVNIIQAGSRAVIEWNSYNIAAGETVNYSMPSGGAILNLINQGSVSQINGTLNANGSVYLVNPHGILFGNSAKIQVGSLVASSLGVDKNDFLTSSGPLSFAGTGGSVINNGNIDAASGSVALLGETVANNNQIWARTGSVTLASGTQMTLDFDGSGLIQVAVSDTVKQNLSGAPDAVLNTGQIQANVVTMEARAATNIFTNAVNHTGQIIARSFSVTSSGTVALVGEGAPVNIDPSAVLVAENGVTISEFPGNPVPPPAPPAPPSGGPGTTGNGGEPDSEANFNAALASSVNPVEGSESASVSTSVVGLYSVEGEGIRLPADQMEEPL